MKHLLVVCVGNICRSPMAQAMLAAALPQVDVSSAGLGALIGMPADPLAVKLLKERGLDISAHRAQQITRQMCLVADMVFVMDADQRATVEKMYPQVQGRVYRLGEFSKKDVADPYRQPETAFRDTLSTIEEGVAQWVQRIQRL